MGVATATWFEDLVSQAEYQIVQNFKLNNDCWQHSAFSVVPDSAKAVIWGYCKFTYLAFICAITFSPFPTSVSSLLYLVLLYIISLLIWKSSFPGTPSQVPANLPLSPVLYQTHPVSSSQQDPLRYLRASPALLWPGRSRSLQRGQSQRKQPGTCSLWDLRSGALPQDKKMPVASQRGTWVGTARSQSCWR